MRTVRGRVVRKYTSKGVQPFNGEMLFMDFPFRRPTNYYLQIDGGHSTEVSRQKFESTNHGDIIEFDVFETSDCLNIIMLTAIPFILLFLAYVAFMR